MADEKPIVLWLPPGVAAKPKLTWRDAPRGTALAGLRERADRGGREPAFTPALTRQAVDEFCRLFPGIEYAGGHIALSDGNLEPAHIGSCIRACLEEMGTPEERDSAEAIDFLSCLLSLDDDESTEGEGEDYGGPPASDTSG